MLSVTDASRRNALVAPERKRYARIPEVLPIPDLIELQLPVVPLVHRPRAAGAVRRDQPHPGLHRQGDGAPLQGVRVRRAQVLRARVPHARPDLLQAALRRRGAAHQGDRRDPEPAGLHGRLPDHDRPGHVHHQRRRARRGQPAGALARASTTPPPRTRPPAGRCTAPRSSPTAAPGWSSRPPPATSSTSRSTASASSRRPSCCAPSATRTTRRWSRCSRASTPARTPYIASTLEKDSTNTRQEALIEVYKKLRPGDPPTGDNAEKLVESLFFNFRRYDLGRVGRYKVNKKLDPVAERMGIDLPRDQRHHQPRGHRGHRRPPHRAQQRPRPGRTTSTTSATAASAPTAS